jgi:RHS repeat-associated protein
MVLDTDGNISQSVTYIPYGEIFVEERNGAWNSPYLFNSKELDEETGLYYYGARYLNPTNGMWLSVDPLFEKYVGMSPYNYCAGNPVKLVDPDGRRISAENEESQSYMKQDFANAFGKERLQYIDFGKDGNVSINNEKAFMKEMSKEQKRLYKNGLKPLINDKEINYKVLYAEKSILGGIERDINSDFGGGAYSSSDKKIVISPTIDKIVVDGAPIYTKVYSNDGMGSHIGYKEDFSQISNRYEIKQNTTSGLFHEFGEAIWDRSSQKHLRGNIIDFENNVRTVMGLESRPYDSTHFNDKDPNLKTK